MKLFAYFVSDSYADYELILKKDKDGQWILARGVWYFRRDVEKGCRTIVEGRMATDYLDAARKSAKKTEEIA